MNDDFKVNYDEQEQFNLGNDSDCEKCDNKAYVEYKDKNYCTWYCAKKG